MFASTQCHPTLIPSPFPPRKGRVLTVCACAKYSVSFVDLPCQYAEDYTNQEYRAFFEINSSGNLTCRILLEYYFSDVTVSFSKFTVKQKGNKLICKKSRHIATETLPSYTACSNSVLNTIGFYNSKGTR